MKFIGIFLLIMGLAGANAVLFWIGLFLIIFN